ncbi:cold shock domain-containing protein [Alphaproteobacteria bacterium]|nr:cold shock domain-containing protein [Alphaproteobacteria bacterium]
MQKAKVAWFSAGKGFGFNALKGSVEEICINIKIVRDAGFETLESSQAVEYETSESQSDRSSDTKLTVL